MTIMMRTKNKIVQTLVCCSLLSTASTVVASSPFAPQHAVPTTRTLTTTNGASFLSDGLHHHTHQHRYRSTPSTSTSLALSSTLELRGGAVAKKTRAAVTNTPTAPSSSSTQSALMLRLKIGFYFGLWYALNVYYNSTWIHFSNLFSNQTMQVFCMVLSVCPHILPSLCLSVYLSVT
jgi:hypothetical protein